MNAQRVVLLALLALAVWQGALLAPRLFRKPAAHEVAVVNEGRRTIGTVQVRVGRQRFDGGPLRGRDSVAFAFRVARDVPIEVLWAWEDRPDEDHVWDGGTVPAGPMVQRFRIAVRDEGGVVFRVTAAPRAKKPQG